MTWATTWFQHPWNDLMVGEFTFTLFSYLCWGLSKLHGDTVPVSVSVSLSLSLFYHFWHRCSNKRSSLIRRLPQYITPSLAGGAECMWAKQHTLTYFLFSPTHTHSHRTHTASEIKQITRASVVPVGGLHQSLSTGSIRQCVLMCVCLCARRLYLQHTQLISKSRKWQWRRYLSQTSSLRPTAGRRTKEGTCDVFVCACTGEKHRHAADRVRMGTQLARKSEKHTLHTCKCDYTHTHIHTQTGNKTVLTATKVLENWNDDILMTMCRHARQQLQTSTRDEGLKVGSGDLVCCHSFCKHGYGW